MKSSNRRWAVLSLLCMALVVAQGANAANPKFPRLIPKNPNAEAEIAARNAAAQQLLGTQSGDWRKNMDFLKALSALPSANSKVQSSDNAQQAERAGDADASSTEDQASSPEPGFIAGGLSAKARPANAAAAGPSPSANFGGFLVAPSYQAIQYPPSSSNGGNWILNTLAVDINNDGYQDLVTVDVSGNLNVMLNDGKGGFLPPVTNSGAKAVMGNNITAPLVYITAGDVNGDGLPDLVVTRWGGSTSPILPLQPAGLYVYLNQGNGKFSNPTIVTPILAVGEQLSAIVVADRDGDGKADIVVVSYQEITDPVTNSTSSTNIDFQTLYSNGDGTFANYGYIARYNYPGYGIIIPNGGAQFTTLGGTKYLALECEDYNYFSVGASVLFFKDTGGARGLAPVANTPAQEVNFPSNSLFAITYANGLSLADVNGDGNPDITLSFGDNYLYGALGSSSGTFGPPQLIESGTFPFAPSGWAVADVNGDGIPDMIDMEYFYDAIWLGVGDGTFADPKVFYANNANNSAYPGSYPGNNLVAADFDRDGILDYATSDSTTGIWYGRSSVFKGHGDGTFAGIPSFGPLDGNPTPDLLGTTFALDLNGDGLSDTVAVNLANGTLVTAISDGKGNFTFNSHALPYGENQFFINAIAGVGDFNGDGRQDVLLTGHLIGNVYKNQRVYSFAVAFSNGDGTFSNPVVVPSSVNLLNFPAGALVGDINGDGKLDLVLPYGGDFDPHGFGTPSVRHNQPGIWAALGNGDGTFQKATYTQLVEVGNNGVLNDLNGDGYPDLLLWDGAKSQIFMVPGSASGFQPQNSSLVLDLSAWRVAAIHTADVNNDGYLDYLIGVQGAKADPPKSFKNGGIQTYLNNGKGAFKLAGTAQKGYPYAGDFVVADFNGDGCADMVAWLSTPSIATTTTYSSHTLLGNCDGTFQAPLPEMMIPALPFFVPAKFTSDGVTSLAVTSGKSANFVLFNQGGTTLNLTTSQSSIAQGGSISFTADVEPTWPNRPIPSGTISFYDKGALLGAQSVAGGSASFSSSSLTPGPHTITVSYSGDENFNPRQTAAQVNVTVVTPAPTQPEISISSPLPNLILKRGDSQTLTLTLAGSPNYNGSVSFSVSGATGGLNVSVNPTSISLSNGAPAHISVALSTLPSTTTAMARSNAPWLGMSFGGTALGMCFFGTKRRRRRSYWVWLLIVPGTLGVCMISSGCGSSHVAKAGTSTIVVTAKPSVAGASVQTTTFTVTVE